jgi:hypothetical protein
MGMTPTRKEYSADRFDVDIAIQSDGSLLVTETTLFQFVGGPFTTVFRDLPTNDTDGITDIAAGVDGVTWPAGKSAGQVEISQGNPIKVTWHLTSASDVSYAFSLTYHVRGVIRQESSADILRWQALPNQYEYPIRTSKVLVTWPEAARLIGSPTLEKGNAQIETNAAHATFTAHDLKANSPLLVTMRFQPGSVIATPPHWQARQASARQSTPLFIAMAVALLMVGSISLFIFWMRHRGETLPAADDTAYPTAPPSDLPPALAGALNGYGAEPAWPNALATVFDFARRGVVSIEEAPEHPWYRSHEFVIQAQAQPDNLRPHERGLWDMLFTPKSGVHPSIKLSELSQHLSSEWKRYAEPLKQEMQVAGWLDPERKQVRRTFLIVGAMLFVAGPFAMLATSLLLRDFDARPILIGLSLILTGVVAFIMASTFSPLSPAGAQEARRWQGFYQYLRDVTRGREFLPRADLWEDYLPYATSYGLAAAWGKLFKQQGRVQLPTWFQALATTRTEDDGVGAFVALMAAAESSGSGSDGAAAAASAAGGGASGAY